MYAVFLVALFAAFSIEPSNKYVIGAYKSQCLFPAGFCCMFVHTLNNLRWADQNGKTPVVYWDNDTLYYQEGGFNGADQPWEYYFRPVSHLLHEPNDPVHRSTPDNSFPRYETFNRSLNIKINMLIQKYIRVRPEVTKIVEDFYQKYLANKTIIGVHLRGTDKKIEIQLPDSEKVLLVAQKIAKKITGGYCFFVATDDQRLLNLAQQRLGSRMVCCDHHRSASDNAVHYKPSGSFHYGRGRPDSPGLLGQEILVDVLLLAKSHYFVHTSSNVALAALFFNPWMINTFLTS